MKDNYSMLPDDATGEIKVTLTNDMMFHCAMQRSKTALKALVCAVKGLDPDDVDDVILLNTIDYSEYSDKEIILDTRILLKDSTIMNIELQMYSQTFWKKRSVLYLCRSYDTLNGGDDYSQLKETIQVCITDQEFFKDQKKEFFAKFQLLNTRYHYPYSTILSLYVLNLNHTELATEEDIRNGLVHWARIFTAKTWEEIRTIATEYQAAEEVATVMYAVNKDVSERTYFEAHRKYIESKVTTENALARAKEELAKKDQQLVEKDKTIESLQQQIKELKSKSILNL